MLSFGFKYGLPADADLVADCRFLPNPFWIPELKGRSPASTPRCSDFVLTQPGATEFITDYAKALEPVLRRVSTREQETRYDRHWLHGRQAPLGCHRRGAGWHPLVVTSPGVAVSVKHRDLGRE